MVELNDPENVHKVPAKTWSKWTVAARLLFNDVYSRIYDMGRVFYHPDLAPAHTGERHATTAWNAAWEAADSATEMARKY